MQTPVMLLVSPLFLLLAIQFHQFSAIPLFPDEKGGHFGEGEGELLQQVAINFVKSARPKHENGEEEATTLGKLDDFSHTYMVGPVTVGTAKPGEKPQRMAKVIFTLATADFWVQDTLARRTKKCSSDRYPVDTFSPANSATYRTVSNHFEVHTSHLEVYGMVGMDKVQIGVGPLLVAPNATIGLALDYNCYFIENSVSGILGLGWPQLAQDPVLGRASPFVNALSELPKPLFSLFIDSAADNGSITFGQLNKANCQNEWKFAPVSKTAYWQLETAGYSVGSQFANGTRQQAILSESITKILGDEADIDAVAAQLGPSAGYADIFQSVTVSCEHFHSGKLPDVHFQLANGIELSLGPAEYMAPNDISGWMPGQCLTYFGYRMDLVRVGLFSGNLDGINWLFGRQFLTKYCTSYDFGQKQVGFALAKKA